MGELSQELEQLKKQLQQLLRQHQNLRQENEKLLGQLAQFQAQQSQQAQQLTQLQTALEKEQLRGAQFDPATAAQLRQKIDRYLKEIDQCLAQLAL